MVVACFDLICQKTDAPPIRRYLSGKVPLNEITDLDKKRLSAYPSSIASFGRNARFLDVETVTNARVIHGACPAKELATGCLTI